MLMNNKLLLVNFSYNALLFSQTIEFIEKELSVLSEKVMVNGALLAPLDMKKVPLITLSTNFVNSIK